MSIHLYLTPQISLKISVFLLDGFGKVKKAVSRCCPLRFDMSLYRDDVLGAQAAGLQGALVRTGKYRQGDENRKGLLGITKSSLIFIHYGFNNNNNKRGKGIKLVGLPFFSSHKLHKI
jgi:hypothetical protein